MDIFYLALTSCLLLIVKGWSAGIYRKFSFASYYGDQMVLQKAPKRATIWGYSPNINETVSIELNGMSLGMTISRAGQLADISVWSFTLPPTEPGGPHQISVQSSQGEITLNDVLFGDVWLCSGQGNMQFTLDMVYNASEELADASRYSNIRVFTVGRRASLTQQYDLSVEEYWSVPSNASLGNRSWTYFSAVCWLFGKYLSTTLGYPVGLIESSYRATPIESWSSAKALGQCSNHHDPSRSKTAPDPQLPTALWNAMIRPLINMTIYGAIWYQGAITLVSTLPWEDGLRASETPRVSQAGPYLLIEGTPKLDRSTGESNALPDTETELYSCRFQAMIKDWRTQFSYGESSEVFPFGFVQVCCIQTPATNVRGYCSLSENVWHPAGIITSNNNSVTVDYSKACTSRDKPSVGAIRYAWRESPCPYKQCAVYNPQSGYPSPPFLFSVV